MRASSVILGAGFLLFAACSGTDELSGDPAGSSPSDVTVTSGAPPPATAPTAATPAPATSPDAGTETPSMPVPVAMTFPGDGGTRFAAGGGRLSEITSVDVPLPGVPQWVVGVPRDDTVVWWVALASGALVEVRQTAAGTGEPVPVGALPPGAPPAIVAPDGGEVTFVRAVEAWGSPGSHPIGLDDGSGVAVQPDGSVVAGAGSFAVAAPPDARLLSDGAAVLVVSGATTRYPHGALGDATEGGSVTLIDTAAGTATTLFELPDPAVIEGTTPMWVDLDGDGSREILVTVSHPDEGARLALYDGSGNVVATGPAIGTGNRWRHQVAAAPFGPDGETEIAAVLTPHIGGTVEFYRWIDDRLEIVAAVPGFSSHQYASPNLDMALAADADGDGAVELVVPTDDHRRLGGIRRTAEGAEVAWLVPLGGRLATNLGTVTRSDGTLTLAAGTEDGVLRIWP